MNTSADAPYLDCAYKLQEYDGRPRRKRSEGKATWPGRKQVYRRFDRDARPTADVLALEGDPVDATTLLQPVIRNGCLIGPLPALQAIRAHAHDAPRALPETLLRLDAAAPPHPVVVAPSLYALASEIDARS